MRKVLFTMFCLSATLAMNAQVSIKETFDSNSFGWTESNYESSNGSAAIEGGVMTIKSKGESKLVAGLNRAFGEDQHISTYFETHCYAPLDVLKPFTIRTKVHVGKMNDADRLAGLILNYKDDGNFYAFIFNNEEIRFARYEDNRLVGSVCQSMKWSKRNNLDQEWVLVYDGNKFQYFVDGLEVLLIRYMEMKYAGVGFYVYGKQELIVDEIEFIQ